LVIKIILHPATGQQKHLGKSKPNATILTQSQKSFSINVK